MPTDDTMIAVAVLPLPNAGMNAPSVDLINTQYETLPKQPAIQ
jgi:hypothetical protein